MTYMRGSIWDSRVSRKRDERMVWRVVGVESTAPRSFYVNRCFSLVEVG